MIPSGARVWIALGHTDMRKGEVVPVFWTDAKPSQYLIR